MAPWIRLLATVVLFVGAILIAFFGAFAVLYQGDSPGGNPTVRIGNESLDAQLVGGVALVLAVVMVMAAWRLVRRSPP